MSDLTEKLRSSTETLANTASVPMAYWDEHSNAVLTAANYIEQLEAELEAERGKVQGLRESLQFVAARVQLYDFEGMNELLNIIDKALANTSTVPPTEAEIKANVYEEILGILLEEGSGYTRQWLEYKASELRQQND